MAGSSESVYRAARRAFIAACEAARVDSIARLHPTRGKGGALLFTDSAALGSRLATRGLLALANDATGSTLAVNLLKANLPLPADARLVLVHAPDPAAFAGVPTDPAWSLKTLAAIAAEDLSRIQELGLMPLGSGATSADLMAAALRAIPCTLRIKWPVETLGEAEEVIRDCFQA